MNLTLPPNELFNNQQSLTLHNRVATLIGGNGSGKSCILRSIFDDKLNGNSFAGTSVVCFSSGQNEAFTSLFRQFLARQRRGEDALGLEGFYFDKSWSKILIFLATTIHNNGRVRNFLREHEYIEESAIGSYREDDSTTLEIEFKVEGPYVAQVRRAIQAEASGEKNTLRQTTYFRSLENFIEKNVQSEYDFIKPIQPNRVRLKSRKVRLTEFPEASAESFPSDLARIDRHPMVGFFVQATDRDFFLTRASAELTFKGGLRLDQLSDGEFQIL